MSNVDDFLNRLLRGPGVLFLGQQYSSLSRGLDPFLDEVQRKFGAQERGYRGLLTIGQDNPVEDTLSWMAERCRRLTPPESLETIAGFPWNSVFSSVVDTIWARPFTNEWRDTQPI